MKARNQKSNYSQIDILINELNSDSESARNKSKTILKMAIEKMIKEGASAQ